MQVWTREVGLSEEVELETEMRSMYDAEDVMDELDYYRLQQHIEGFGSWCNHLHTMQHQLPLQRQMQTPQSEFREETESP
jgi:hypothetical protein